MKPLSKKIQYDKESGVLVVEVKKGKSVDSDIKKNVVIDYDRNGDVVRVNFYDFPLQAVSSNRRALREFHKIRQPLRFTS